MSKKWYIFLLLGLMSCELRSMKNLRNWIPFLKKKKEIANQDLTPPEQPKKKEPTLDPNNNGPVQGGNNPIVIPTGPQGLHPYFGNGLVGGVQMDLKTMIGRYFMKYLMDQKREGSLPNLLAGREKVSLADGSTGWVATNRWDWSWSFKENTMANIFKECATCVVLSAGITGPIEATEKVMGNVVGGTLEGIIYGVKYSAMKVWNFLFHNNASPVTNDFIRCLTNRINTTMNSLKEEARESSYDGDVTQGLVRLDNFQTGPKESEQEGDIEESGPEQERDAGWEEISGLCLMQIMQLVYAISQRQKYYRSTDPIITSTNNLICALVGKRLVFDDIYGVMPEGGVYAHIARAKRLSDLATPDVARSLKLLHSNIDATLDELKILIEVNESQSAEVKKILGMNNMVNY